MIRKILLIGDQKVNDVHLLKILESCGLSGFEITHNPGLATAQNVIPSGDFCLVIINENSLKDIKRFLSFQRRKNAFLPIILLCDVGRKELELLISLGACEIIHSANVNVATLTEAILSALERKRIETELRSRDTIMRAINNAAEVFLSQSNWDTRIIEVLAHFGTATLADKVCIYQNEGDGDQGIVSTIMGGWKSCDEFLIDESHADNECGLQGFAVNRWMSKLRNGEVVFGSLQEFLTEDQPRLAKRQIKSLAMIPIFSDQLWWGFMTFEHCRYEKRWTGNEIEALKTAAKIIGAGIARLDAETRLTYLANHDYLTSLPNRMLLADRFELAIARADRSDKKFGIIAIDLDKFKHVNDSYGHPFGDKVLVEIAWRLSETIRTSDTCSRVGGDEFTILAEGISNKKDLLRVMEKLSKAIVPPITIDGKSVHIKASMGGSIYPNHGTNMEELMKAADIALYQVKDVYSGFKVASEMQSQFFEK